MTTPPNPPAGQEKPKVKTYAFPDGGSLYVGTGLLVASILALIGLLQLLSGTGLFAFALCPTPETTRNAACTETARFAIAIFAGTVGAAIYAIERFIQHAMHDKDYEREYSGWYILRPLQGSLLAVVFYLLLRGGLLALGTPSGSVGADLNPYGLASFCALVGMFSNDASKRLKLTFQTLFSNEPQRSAKDGEKDDDSAGPSNTRVR